MGQKIRDLLGYREWTHCPETSWSLSLLTGRTCRDYYTAQRWAELIRMLREEGFREPLKLEYHPGLRRAYLGEGNHRLAAAGLAGYKAVPLWGLGAVTASGCARPGASPASRSFARMSTATSRPASSRPT